MRWRRNRPRALGLRSSRCSAWQAFRRPWEGIMAIRALLWAIALACAPLAVQAESNNTAKWGQVGGWQIKVDRTAGDGCFAMQVFERGTVVRIGIDVSNKALYLIFG